ncbi:MAG: hypothetical protein LBC78_01760 [Oscillospiraceae bacterium]|jgi:hypothetical protein|nr:hypothetical protein [Oscillospiraceae bacterium]
MKLMEALAALLKVKTLVTLLVMSVFAILAFQGRLEANSVVQTVSMVTAFYFGTVSERNGGAK